MNLPRPGSVKLPPSCLFCATSPIPSPYPTTKPHVSSSFPHHTLLNTHFHFSTFLLELLQQKTTLSKKSGVTLMGLIILLVSFGEKNTKNNHKELLSNFRGYVRLFVLTTDLPTTLLLSSLHCSQNNSGNFQNFWKTPTHIFGWELRICNHHKT